MLVDEIVDEGVDDVCRHIRIGAEELNLNEPGARNGIDLQVFLKTLPDQVLATGRVCDGDAFLRVNFGLVGEPG